MDAVQAHQWREVELTSLGYKVLAQCSCGVEPHTLPGLLLERATKLHADRQQGGDATTPTGVLYIKCLGDCCKDRPLELHATGGCIYSGNAFEAHAGRQGRKKWRETIRVLPQNISLKAWLSSVGREYNRADSDGERQQYSPTGHRDGFVHAAVAAAAGGSAPAPLWPVSEQLKQMAALAAAGGLPGAAPHLGSGAAPSGLLQALLGQPVAPAPSGSPNVVGLQGAGMPPDIASLLQQAAHAAAQPPRQPLQQPAQADAAAAVTAAVAAAARQRAEGVGAGAGDSSAHQDAAVLQALSGLVRQLQHAQAGSQREQPLPQQPPALAAALAAAAGAGGQQDGQMMEALITVVQQLAAQREQLQEQQAQLAAQAQQMQALTAQVAAQAEQLSAACAALQAASAARLRQAEQLSLQARQQQELWGAVQTLQQNAVQAVTGAQLPMHTLPAGAAADAHPAPAAGEAPADLLRLLSREAAAAQPVKNSAHGAHASGAGPAAGLHGLQAVLAAMAAVSRQHHQQQPQQQQQQHPQQQQQQQQQQQSTSPAGHQAQTREPGAGSQLGGAASPAGGTPRAGPAAPAAPSAHDALHVAAGGSGSSSPSRKRPREDSHDS